MRKLLPIAVLAALAVAVGATLASASQTTTSLSFAAVAQSKHEVYLDIGREGDSEGDGVIMGETLLQGAKKIGRSSIMCFFARVAARCNGTLWLPGGTIEAGGAIGAGRTFVVPVLGGTGKYVGAAGVARITRLNDRRSRYVLELAE